MLPNFSALSKWLFCSFTFIFCLLVARVIFTNNIGYSFLIWNIFLAYIPYILSIFLLKSKGRSLLVQLSIVTCWLLFFPNALYIVTDIIHIAKPKQMPIWFDVILLLTASFTGLVLAFASLLNVDIFLKKFVGNQYKKLYIHSLLFLGSFGVYLGRFLRFNSWDILHKPQQIVYKIVTLFIHPIQHINTWVITFILFVFFSVCWYFITTLKANWIEHY